MNAREDVASLYLRYERRELFWATFLNESGLKADASGGRWPCEEFYAMLNELEESDFALAVEQRQRDHVVTEYREVMESVRRTYQAIRGRGSGTQTIVPVHDLSPKTGDQLVADPPGVFLVPFEFILEHVVLKGRSHDENSTGNEGRDQGPE